MGQSIVPFIDETRLLSSTRKAKEELKEHEAQRNSIHTDLLFVRAFSDFGYQLLRKIEGPKFFYVFFLANFLLVWIV